MFQKTAKKNTRGGGESLLQKKKKKIKAVRGHTTVNKVSASTAVLLLLLTHFTCSSVEGCPKSHVNKCSAPAKLYLMRDPIQRKRLNVREQKLSAKYHTHGSG